MNARALSEVYSIINIMDQNIVKKISPNFLRFIQLNRDVLYNPEFKELPDNFDNLEHDTKVIFALIYKKYFDENGNANFDIEKTEPQIEVENNNEFEEIKQKNNSFIVYKNSWKEKFLELLKKMRKHFFIQ